jgi:hypothetical protein
LATASSRETLSEHPKPGYFHTPSQGPLQPSKPFARIVWSLDETLVATVWQQAQPTRFPTDAARSTVSVTAPELSGLSALSGVAVSRA